MSSQYPDTILHWIDDADVASAGGAAFEKRCPIDDRVIAAVTRGTGADATRAVDAAVRAADGWGRMPAPLRGAILGRAAARPRAPARP
jgi:aldehyde dehydrogenase